MLYSWSRGITTAVIPAPGNLAGQQVAVGPESHGTPVVGTPMGLLPIPLSYKTNTDAVCF